MILLMRHGETEHGDGFYGQTDSALTHFGWQQMLTQAHDLTVDAIICSPLQRCAGFAQYLSQQQALPLFIEMRWQEYNFGDWEGRNLADLWQSHPAELEQLWQDPTQFTPPNAEPFNDFIARIAHARDRLTALQAQYPKLLIITHAGVIRVLRLLSQQNQLNNWLTYPVAHASLHQYCPLTLQVKLYEG